MVDQEELAICRRRGHHLVGIAADAWRQCKWCRIWVREVRKLEEREDDPPKEERDPLGRLRE